MTLKVSDDASSYLEINNAITTDSAFAPRIMGVNGAASYGLYIEGAITTDSGAVPAINIDGRTAAGGAIGTRPLVNFTNTARSRHKFNYDGTLYTAAAVKIATTTAPSANCAMRVAGHIERMQIAP